MLVSLEFGKSTLTNRILGEERAETGEISKKNKMGKNTTTETSLYEIGKNTYLLDTPGFQTIDIYEIESRDLANYYIDFRKYLERCEYVSCTHIKEENCGIRKALEECQIEKTRYENYIKIYNDLKYKEEHKW